MRKMVWRVRVRKALEDWVDVEADTPREAEEKAAVMPTVLSVFGKSAIRGDKPLGTISAPMGVEDDDGL